MSKTMKLWRLLNTPIAFPKRPRANERQRARRMLRRHERLIWCADRERELLVREVHRAVEAQDPDRLSRSTRQLVPLFRKLQWLEALGRIEESKTPVYVFSSWMLKDSFQYCTAAPEEAMHFILGVEKDGFAIGTNLVPFGYSHRSVVGATGNHRDTHRISIEAHESGHRILALIHSHPGRGINANRRSSIDEANQRIWERTTRVIGAIWSRDGYLRWYSSKLKFDVQIIGNHLKRVNDHVWKLDLGDDPAPESFAATEKLAV